jgi:hypothetical protein
MESAVRCFIVREFIIIEASIPPIDGDTTGSDDDARTFFPFVFTSVRYTANASRDAFRFFNEMIEASPVELAFIDGLDVDVEGGTEKERLCEGNSCEALTTKVLSALDEREASAL